MKRIPALLCLLFAQYIATAQNLVHNPDFALHTACPDAPGEVARVNDWYQVTQGTPDFFDSCGSFFMSVPSNIFGSQISPYYAMLGMYTYDSISPYREYIGTDIPPLTPGFIYDVTIRVSLADSVRFASDGIGVFFYVNNKPDSMINSWIPVTPQIDYSSFGIITDKVNWTTMTKQFVADSSYTHLVIGAFKPDDNIHVSSSPGYSTTLNHISYYYIDSVSVAFFKSAITNVAASPGNIKTTVAPNPFRDFAVVSFDYSAGAQYALDVFNAQGAVVWQQGNIRSGSVRIDRNALPGGFYYYQLRNESGIVANGKIVAE